MDSIPVSSGFTVLLLQVIGMSTVVPDPCPSDITGSTIVADMCKSSFATEDVEHSGSYKIDSVVLRIMTQQDNCICRVTIANQIQPVVVGLRKYDGLSSSAPEESVCGLDVDINHIPDTSTGTVIAPIKCIDNVSYRTMPLLQNGTLQVKSRTTNGKFTRGYCMRITRDINSDHSQVLRINCDAQMTTERTTEQIKTSDPTKKYQKMTTATDPTTGLEQTTYIAIGAGSGVALILLVVLVVICLRRKSAQKQGTNGNVKKSYQQDESVDTLSNNVLYVPAGEFDIIGGNYSTADVNATRSSNKILSMKGTYSTVNDDTPRSSTNRLSMDGNYSTVELDEHLERKCSDHENSEPGQTKEKQKPTIKPKHKSSCINSEEHRLSDQNIKHIAPPNDSDNVYAIVDKSRKNVPATSGSKGEGTCQPDQIYAVVDKARKRKSSQK